MYEICRVVLDSFGSAGLGWERRPGGYDNHFPVHTVGMTQRGCVIALVTWRSCWGLWKAVDGEVFVS